MRRIITMFTVGAIFAAFLGLSAFSAVAEKGGKACEPGAPGCEQTSTVDSTIGSTVESSTKGAGASPGFQTTSTVESTVATTTECLRRGQCHAGTTPTTTTTVTPVATTTIPGPCRNPGGQPHGGPCQ